MRLTRFAPLIAFPLYAGTIDVTMASRVDLTPSSTLTWAFSVWNFAYHSGGTLPLRLLVRATGPAGQQGDLLGEVRSVDGLAALPFTLPWTPDAVCSGRLGCAVASGASGWVEVPENFWPTTAATPYSIAASLVLYGPSILATPLGAVYKAVNLSTAGVTSSLGYLSVGVAPFPKTLYLDDGSDPSALAVLHTPEPATFLPVCLFLAAIFLRRRQ
jgi:hypothetical protein